MNAAKLLKCVLFTPGPKGMWGIPVLMEGSPGSAKSSIVEQVGFDAGLHVETVIASVREPADFLGLPIPNGGCVEYMPTSWAYRAAQAKRSVGFLDELNTAPEAVQNALLRVVLDRAVGDLQLPPGVRILAAQNSTEDAAGAHDISTPLANRFLHWAWEAPSVDQWTDWVISAGTTDKGGSALRALAAEQEEIRVMNIWDLLYSKAKGQVTGFINKRPELLHKQPKPGDPAASKAWPSRRTWEMAMRVIAGSEAHNLDASEKETLVAGCVGTGAAAEFIQWLTENDLPDPTALLEGKVTWNPDTRLDRTMAVLNSCAAIVVSKDRYKSEGKSDDKSEAKRKKHAARLWTMLAGHAKNEADVTIPCARALVKAQLSGLEEAKPTLMKLEPIFRATGMMA